MPNPEEGRDLAGTDCFALSWPLTNPGADPATKGLAPLLVTEQLAQLLAASTREAETDGPVSLPTAPLPQAGSKQQRNAVWGKRGQSRAWIWKGEGKGEAPASQQEGTSRGNHGQNDQAMAADRGKSIRATTGCRLTFELLMPLDLMCFSGRDCGFKLGRWDEL